MPENGLPKPQERPIGILHQSHQKRLIKYPLDTAFSEKSRVLTHFQRSEILISWHDNFKSNIRARKAIRRGTDPKREGAFISADPSL
jgi:hypothetical protein